MLWKIFIRSKTRLLILGCCVFLVACGSSEPATSTANSEAAARAEIVTTAMLIEHGGPSLRDGVFSRKQVIEGRKLFFDVCIECHQPEAFVGPGFIDAWAGQTVDALFQQIRTTMPENAPGRLSRREYTRLLAFVFEKNGLPAGEVDMPNRPEQLKEILIVGALVSADG